MGKAERLVLWFRAVTSRVHSPFFWRALYWLIDRELTIRAIAYGCSLIAQRRAQSPRRVANRLASLLVGWPHHPGTPWVNLNVSRTHHRVLRTLEPRSARTPKRAPRAAGSPERVGVVGRLDLATCFTRSFFTAAPKGLTVFAFDFESESNVAEAALGDAVAGYGWSQLDEIDELAAAIEKAELDLLLVDVRRPELDAVLDRISTPCVAFLCVEVHVRFHPAVSFHLYCLQQADYLIRDNRLFCATSHTRFSDQLTFPCWLPYPVEELGRRSRPGWADREPLIFLHGRLSKASQPFLECLFELLADDASLRFLLAGSDKPLVRSSPDRGSLARIRDTARRFGVERRVEFLGPYSPMRDASGARPDPAWVTIFDHLTRARLAPDPWPLPGAVARFEAYLYGTPVAHMGVREEPAYWGRPQHLVTAEHKSLLIPESTAYSPDEYLAVCRRLLYEPQFADSVSREQAERATRLTDLSAFWTRLLECYEGWRGGDGTGVPARYLPE